MEEKHYEFERELFYALTEKKALELPHLTKFCCLLAGALVERGVFKDEEVRALLNEVLIP